MRTLKTASTAAVGILLAASFALSPTVAAETNLLMSQTRSYPPTLAPLRLHVEANRLLDKDGRPVLLRGVNIPSLEWTDRGEHMPEALAQAIKVWKANLIRLPLAQDRWFGKVASQKDGGAEYRRIVDRLVETAGTNGVYMDLDLHWSERGTWANEGGNLGQHLMPDSHSVVFWQDVASRYRNHPNVLFGLYNEPHDVSWSIWRDGGAVVEKAGRRGTNQPPVTYPAVGLQKLYDTVRAVGAENIVTVSGLNWGYDLSGVLEGHALAGTNVVYETHPYPTKKEWEKCFGEVSKKYPVLIGEWGGGAKDLEYGRRLMDFAAEHQLSWTAWCFHPSAGPPLLKNWSFEPSPFGEFVKQMLTTPASAPAANQ